PPAAVPSPRWRSPTAGGRSAMRGCRSGDYGVPLSVPYFASFQRRRAPEFSVLMPGVAVITIWSCRSHREQAIGKPQASLLFIRRRAGGVDEDAVAARVRSRRGKSEILEDELQADGREAPEIAPVAVHVMPGGEANRIGDEGHDRPRPHCFRKGVIDAV